MVFFLFKPLNTKKNPIRRAIEIKFSFVSPCTELTHVGSTGGSSSGGKGHVKSASVSSPGPSEGTPSDPLRQRY